MTAKPSAANRFLAVKRRRRLNRQAVTPPGRVLSRLVYCPGGNKRGGKERVGRTDNTKYCRLWPTLGPARLLGGGTTCRRQVVIAAK